MPDQYDLRTGLIYDDERTKKRLTEMFEWAIKSERLGQLLDNLDTLRRSETVRDKRGRLTYQRCLLYPDFAPLSLGFTWQTFNGEGKAWETDMVGGLIYHGELPEGGHAETFSVTLEPCEGWQIHT